jgi:hypothetical protein
MLANKPTPRSKSKQPKLTNPHPPIIRREESQEQLVEKNISRSWEKELEGTETYCQRKKEMEGTSRQPMFLMDIIII